MRDKPAPEGGISALRLIVTGYGMALLPGFSVGTALGCRAGGLTAWFGGGVLCLLLAWIQFRAENRGTDANGPSGPCGTLSP